MKQLLSDESVSEMFAAEFAVLFVFVDWSEYARRGAQLVERAEKQFIERSLGRSVSWWLGDFTSIESPMARVVHEWLTTQEQRRALHLFPGIAVGNGAVVWVSRGEIVSFEASAVRLEIEGVLERTQDLVIGKSN